jgi:flagellar protein FlaG
MTLNVPPPGGVDPTGNPAPAARGVRGSADGKQFSKVLAEASQVDISVPSSPPAEVADAIGRASARYDELRGQQRELHFGSDPNTGRVVVEVRDLDGNVLRTISPSKALDVIGGAPLEEDR